VETEGKEMGEDAMKHQRQFATISYAVCLHCKNISISTDISQRVFLILTELVPYTFVSVNRRNNEARIQTCTELVPLKYGKLATEYPSIYTADCDLR